MFSRVQRIPANLDCPHDVGAPNISNHYHAFGKHTLNNAGRFISSEETAIYQLATGIGTRMWNGKEYGNDFKKENGSYEANMVTSRAVFETSNQDVQPASVLVFPCIKI